MSGWFAIWIVIAIVAVVGEVLTTGLFLASIALAAVVTAVLSILLPGLVQVAVFAGLSLAGIAVFRPIVVHALGMEASPQVTGPVSHSHLVGRRAVVTRTVDGTGGQIRVGEGEFWSARAFDEDDIFPPGTSVEILLVTGLTALVASVSPPALPPDTDATHTKGTYSWTP